MDGYALAATLYLPRGKKHRAVLINAATAVPRGYYDGFARYLARQGCAVLTYDYRGIGGSRPKGAAGHKAPSLRGFDASMSDWAARDITGAVGWMRERYRALPLVYVGHSFGGQALGLLPNNTEVTRALLISAQAASWKLMPPPERYRVYLFMNYVGAPVARAVGYLPGRLMGGEDLPKGVFLEWTRWVRNERYLLGDPALEARANFANYKAPLRALTFTDDSWAPRSAVELLCSAFTATAPEIVSVTPIEAGVKKIGHIGFFRREHRGTLWRDAADWLGVIE
ncbi:MAG: alpha/beta fold hydrolase [Xanthobacteraceae bacterium]|nr:alpha/beta fold hydrolase [Xanthobacteraceae bacterium]